LEPQGEAIQISAPAFVEGARVEQLLVQLGDRVTAGQVIAILDSRDRLQAAFERAQTRVQLAQSRLAQVKAGAKKGAIAAQAATIERLQAELQGQIQAQSATIERLQAELENATAECTRYQKLFRDGAISTSERDNTCLKQDTWKEQLAEARATRQRTTATLRQQLSEARATLNQVAEVRPVDVAVAQAEVNEAQAAVREAKANLDLAYVRSPQAGQILKIHTRAGEMIGQKGIVELGQTEQMYAVAEVYETDISRVRTGQPATITSRGLTGELTGTVAEIGLQIGKKDVLGTDPAADADARVVEVKIRLDAASSEQVRGLTNLQVNVVIHSQT
jgi:HlyD family secretion protein